jgi:hypothetical protein
MVCTADNFTAFRTRTALHCPSTLTNSVGMAVFALKPKPSAMRMRMRRPKTNELRGGGENQTQLNTLKNFSSQDTSSNLSMCVAATRCSGGIPMSAKASASA